MNLRREVVSRPSLQPGLQSDSAWVSSGKRPRSNGANQSLQSKTKGCFTGAGQGSGQPRAGISSQAAEQCRVVDSCRQQVER